MKKMKKMRMKKKKTTKHCHCLHCLHCLRLHCLRLHCLRLHSLNQPKCPMTMLNHHRHHHRHHCRPLPLFAREFVPVLPECVSCHCYYCHSCRNNRTGLRNARLLEFFGELSLGTLPCICEKRGEAMRCLARPCERAPHSGTVLAVFRPCAEAFPALSGRRAQCRTRRMLHAVPMDSFYETAVWRDAKLCECMYYIKYRI